MQLYYSETNYDVVPPKDINCSLLLYNRRILAICTRQGMIDRLAKLGILAIGIWEISEEAFKSIMGISDIVIVIGRDRIHPIFEDKMKHIEEYVVSNQDRNTQEHSFLC
jgi:hypothetical protein